MRAATTERWRWRIYGVVFIDGSANVFYDSHDVEEAYEDLVERGEI